MPIQMGNNPFNAGCFRLQSQTLQKYYDQSVWISVKAKRLHKTYIEYRLRAYDRIRRYDSANYVSIKQKKLNCQSD